MIAKIIGGAEAPPAPNAPTPLFKQIYLYDLQANKIAPVWVWQVNNETCYNFIYILQNPH